MKIFMTIVRVVVAALAAVVLFVVPFLITSASGVTTIDATGAIIDLVAAIVFVAMIAWMWVDRANLA